VPRSPAVENHVLAPPIAPRRLPRNRRRRGGRAGCVSCPPVCLPRRECVLMAWARGVAATERGVAAE